MGLGLGITKGLSYSNEWDKDITRMYQREEYAAQVRQEKERKTQFYANLLKQGHASNPRAETELEDFYKGLNLKLAKIVTENPDLETNVTAMQEFLDVSDQYINNDILRKDKQVAGEFEKLRNAVSQKQLTQYEYEAEVEKYNNYINGKPGDGQEPYVFTNFEIKTIADLSEETLKLTSKVEEKGPLDTSSGLYGKVIKPESNDLEFKVNAKYSEPKSKLTIDKAFSDYISDNPSMGGKYYGPAAARNWFRDFTAKAGEIRSMEGVLSMWGRQNASGTTRPTETALTERVVAIKSLMGQQDKNGNFIESKMPGASSDAYFTFYGGSKKPIVNLNTGAMVLRKTTSTDKNGQQVNELNYVNFDLDGKNVQVNKTGTGNWITIGGIPYLEMDIEIENPGDKVAGIPFTYNQDTLDSYGFTQQGYTTEGMGVDFSIRKVNGIKHTGKIYAPLLVTEPGLSEWSGIHGGQEEKNVANEFYKEPKVKQFISDLNNNIGNTVQARIDFFNTYKSTYIRSVTLTDANLYPKMVNNWNENQFVWGIWNGQKVIIDTSKTKDNIFNPDDFK